jgi:GxxExxY protein
VAAELQRPLVVRYKDVVVGEYDADLIVAEAVIVELKISPQYDKRDEAQLLNELKATGMKVGLLINFGRYKVEFKRLVF